MFKPQAHRLIKTFPIDIPGRNLLGKLYFASTRTSGRRILVEEDGNPVYDTDNCYDLANATNTLDHWCLRQLVCTHCGTKGLTDNHGQDAETGLPICEACCTKARGTQQTASMTADDLAASVATLAEAQREKPKEFAAVAADEVGDDDGPDGFPF